MIIRSSLERLNTGDIILLDSYYTGLHKELPVCVLNIEKYDDRYSIIIYTYNGDIRETQKILNEDSFVLLSWLRRDIIDVQACQIYPNEILISGSEEYIISSIHVTPHDVTVKAFSLNRRGQIIDWRINSMNYVAIKLK